MYRSAVDFAELKSRDMTKFKSFDNVLDFAISREIVLDLQVINLV